MVEIESSLHIVDGDNIVQRSKSIKQTNVEDRKNS